VTDAKQESLGTGGNMGQVGPCVPEHESRWSDEAQPVLAVASQCLLYVGPEALSRPTGVGVHFGYGRSGQYGRVLGFDGAHVEHGVHGRRETGRDKRQGGSGKVELAQEATEEGVKRHQCLAQGRG